MRAAAGKRRGGSAAAVLDFAVAQILGEDAALGALPSVLDRMVAAFGLRAAILTPDQLLELAWNDPLGVGPDRVKFGVMRLRRKLGQDAGEPGAAIEAVRGFGYKYVPPGLSATVLHRNRNAGSQPGREDRRHG